MDDTVGLIMKRRSIRKFKNQVVAEELMARLLASAVRAPTTALGHFYSIVRVVEPQLRERLREIAGQGHVRQGELLIFCADVRRATRWAEFLGCERRITGYTSLVFGTIDATAAAENLVIAAEALGLGSCYIGMFGHRAGDVCRVLHLPDGVLPVFGLVLGYPAEDPPLRPRLPVEFVVHRDGYRDLDEDEVRRCLEIIGEGLGAGASFADRGRVTRSMLEGAWWQEGEQNMGAALKVQGFAP